MNTIEGRVSELYKSLKQFLIISSFGLNGCYSSPDELQLASLSSFIFCYLDTCPVPLLATKAVSKKS